MPTIHGFHGSNQKFDKFDAGKARVAQDFYGGGTAYFADNFIVAKQYAKAAVKRNGGQEYVYRAQLQLKNVFDVDKQYTGKELKPLLGSNLEQFARSAGIFNIGVDRYTVLSKLKTGDIELTGDQIFRGLSNGMQKTALAREKLKKNKFDALRYNGGRNAAAFNAGGRPTSTIKHSVYIVYNPDDIKIIGLIGPTVKDENDTVH